MTWSSPPIRLRIDPSMLAIIRRTATTSSVRGSTAENIVSLLTLGSQKPKPIELIFFAFVVRYACAGKVCLWLMSLLVGMGKGTV
jgi:hypothetical protein